MNIIARAEHFWEARNLPVDDESFQSPQDSIFIGGCGRSGTTLLRVMLASGEELAGGPELNIHTNLLSRLQKYFLLPKVSFLLYDETAIQEVAEKFSLTQEEVERLRDESKSFPRFLDSFFALILHKSGKKRFVEKTPKNATILPYLFRYFPKAKFIHIIRDGRDVACSLRHHPKYVWKDGQKNSSGIVNPIEKCIRRWVEDVTAARKLKNDSRYIEVRYEALLQNPEKEMRRLCGFLGIAFSPHMLEKKEEGQTEKKYSVANDDAFGAIKQEATGRWKKDLSKREAEIFEREAGMLLHELGYEKDSSWLEFYNEEKQET